MRFEHLIEINAASVATQTVVPPFTREQLWRGLMARVHTPQRFPLGPDSCAWREVEPGVIQRTVNFGANAMKDEVQTEAFQKLEFTPQPHGDTTPIRLTITIEEPQAGQMVLRFVYESLSELSAEEAYFNEYRHNAWLHNDRDMVRTLRQWLVDEGL
ncbi:AtaL-like protein [Aquabacterium sp. CECT 9606]|uniref:AtaL-like protein n=1 Tax=Aquabacterium sp. CECT 9606 TaxID=2845822 RepID=UPI001E2A0797|nr:AtaL-like protein [Aquabacterium sp. CECT 9606]CAH0351450.1 hypothetical protein AQB9606_02111 [Aquabacterium sp. CECT 9606]